jgi:hypothetical protein
MCYADQMTLTYQQATWFLLRPEPSSGHGREPVGSVETAPPTIMVPPAWRSFWPNFRRHLQYSVLFR